MPRNRQDKTTQATSIRALRRALDVLSYFGPEKRSATLSELARETNLATSTVARIPATLESAEFFSRQADGRYRVGSQLVRPALMAPQGVRLYDISPGHLKTLSEETGETANLAIQDKHGDARCIPQVPVRLALSLK